MVTSLIYTATPRNEAQRGNCSSNTESLHNTTILLVIIPEVTIWYLTDDKDD